jgi:hypothetical protein
MYDFELPSGFQDADIEMADLQAAANRESRSARFGLYDLHLGPRRTREWRRYGCGQAGPDGGNAD